jgi:hypothetical protein
MIVKLGDSFLDLDKVTALLLEGNNVVAYDGLPGTPPLRLKGSDDEVDTVRFLLQVRARLALFNANALVDSMNKAEGQADAA